MALNFVKEAITIGADKITDKTFTFFKQGFRLNGAIGEPEYRDVTVSGIDVLNLPNAKANGLNYCKLYGKCDEYSDEYLGTVTLEGKCEQRNLPEGYTQVEYIQSSGAQYIATSVVGNCKVVLDAQGTQTRNTSQVVVGFHSPYGGFFGSYGDTGKWAISPVVGNSEVDYSTRVTARIDFNSSNSTFTIDGVEGSFYVDNASGLNKNNTFDLFAIRKLQETTRSYFAYARVFSCQFYQNNALVCNLIPARRNSDNVLGMYDTVTGTFLTNQGTGTFTAGADVVPTPTTPLDIVCNNGVVKVNRNLFNENNITSGYAINANGSINTNSSFGYTDLIPVENIQYALKNITYQNITWTLRIHEYDSSGAWLQQNTELLVDKNINTHSFSISNVSTKYIRFSLRIVNGQNVNVLQLIDPAHGNMNNIYTDGVVETVTDNLGNSATAEMLLAISSFGKDTQEILSGLVTRNIGIKILDGTENWQAHNTWYWASILPSLSGDTSARLLCTHFTNQSPVNDLSVHRDTADSTYLQISYNAMANATALKSYLANQYANGTPVIILYCQTPATSTVTAQFLSKAPVIQTAGSISGMSITTTDTRKTTPTPAQPLDIICNNGVVKVSPNLFDKSLFSNDTGLGIVYTSFQVKNGTYTMSSPDFPYTSSTNVFFLAGNVSTGASSSDNGVAINKPITITVEDGYYTIGHRYETTSNPNHPINFNWQIEKGATATTYKPYKQIYTDGTVETVKDSLNNTATAENLLAVENYKDVQEVLSGNVTKSVNILVLDGTENWTYNSQYLRFILNISDMKTFATRKCPLLCSHYYVVSDGRPLEEVPNNSIYTTPGPSRINIKTANYNNVDNFKAFLASQYTAGTPLIIVYPLETAATSTVTGQTLTTKKGTNTIEITQASLTGLPLEVSYKAGVTVTVTQVEDLNLDNSVTVTIGG